MDMVSMDKGSFIRELLELYREFQHSKDFNPRVIFDGDGFRDFINFIVKKYEKPKGGSRSAQTPQGQAKEG